MTLTNLRILRRFCTRNVEPCFVTTPIFYVNAAPHIGHLYSAAIADAISRYGRIKNPARTQIFSTGTDEHGTKIQQAAEKNKVHVKEYCDRISSEYQNVFSLANISCTDFIRTTEERHKKAVQTFWNTLKAKDCIYSTKYSGWYCVSDETFLTESQLKGSSGGVKISEESGHPVEWTEEQNYMFKLSQFQEDVIHWIKQGNRIRPQKFEKILLQYLEEPLPDISISRPLSRVRWGIPVPDDETQTIYVWLDALVNYLTCVGYPEKNFIKKWPPTVQVIGKDILKFHGIYWPAFLIATGIEPPGKLLVHSHWTVDGQKMSKSKFNVVNPVEKAEIYTMEGLRYFLLREGVAHSDGNYSDVKIVRILNSELADTLGNLLSRGCAKALNPKQVFPRIHQEQFEEISKLDTTKHLLNVISELPDKCAHHYESYNFHLVVDSVITVLHAANNFFESCKPWELKRKKSIQSGAAAAIISDKQKLEDVGKLKDSIETGNNCYKNPDGDGKDDDNKEGNINRRKLETIISIKMDTLRKCAIILQPIIPDITKKLLDKLNIKEDERSWSYSRISRWDNLYSSRTESSSSGSFNNICNNVDSTVNIENVSNIGEEKSLGKLDAILFRRVIIEANEKKKVKSSN